MDEPGEALPGRCSTAVESVVRVFGEEVGAER